METPRRHLSMLRSYTAADALTVANAACGTICIFLCLDYIAADNRKFLWAASLLLPLALVFDVLDGYALAFKLGRFDNDFWFGAYRIGPIALHPFALVYVASGSAMISATLRIPTP